MNKKITSVLKLVSLCILGLTISCLNSSSKKKSTVDYSYDVVDQWLKLDTNYVTVLDSIGEPEKKGSDNYWGALGTYVQNWDYPSQGVSLEMESAEQNGDKKVLSITLTEPCSKLISKSIGIGSKKEAITKLYSDKISKEFSNNDLVVLGSIYGGVLFELKDNTVISIFIGASAE